MSKVRPKKYLGQHFLKDQRIACRIVEALQCVESGGQVLEIGPGMGILTQYLARIENVNLTAVEVDHESVDYLRRHWDGLHIIEADFLKLDLEKQFAGPLSIIGNFPYNISSQIFFKVLDNRHMVKQVVGMLQKEVADRIVSPPGNKVYGILSVLLQGYFDVEYLFTVEPGVFHPPPKVRSAVIRLSRNTRKRLDCDETLFFKIVKQGFQNRRKVLRNALKPLNLPADFNRQALLNKRAEQLSTEDFIYLTQLANGERSNTV